ncbi:MAG TPA: alkaline phosphatase family protein, partial [Sphingomicrobium sp.]|nr:alkaline phosphatase family protein [Sphingomicrobium sp.]
MISALGLLPPVLGVLLLATPAAHSQQPTQPQPAVVPHVTDTTTPKLVLFITIDAMRSDYLARFEGQLIGGLGRLYRGGAFFTNGFQDHAITETAPGHSVTMSGR